MIALKRLWIWTTIELVFIAVRTVAAVLIVPQSGGIGLAVAYLVASLVHLANTCGWYLAAGFSIQGRQIASGLAGVFLIASLAWWGSQVVLDMRVYLLGAVILGAYLVIILHMTVGLPDALAWARRAVSQRGAK
jgi:hypothetical protein